jgi:hypothetical protein
MTIINEIIINLKAGDISPLPFILYQVYTSLLIYKLSKIYGNIGYAILNKLLLQAHEAYLIYLQLCSIFFNNTIICNYV